MRNLIFGFLLSSLAVFAVTGSDHNFKDLRIIPKSTANRPAGIEGQLFYNLTTHRLEVRDNNDYKQVVGTSTADTLTNKILTGNTAVNLISGSGTLVLNTSGTATIPNATDTLVGKATADAFTNKTFDAEGTGNSLVNIKDANIKAAAGIAVNKLAALTPSKAVVSDGSGFLGSSATTSTELGYVAGVTSGIQTQIDSISTSTSGQGFVNLGLGTSVASSALTINLKQANGTSDPSTGTAVVKIPFRSATATNGGYNLRSVTSALSIVISSGSSLGQIVSSQPNWVYVYAIDNAGTVELAVSGSKIVDEGTVYSTTAEGGAGAADSKSTLYSTTSRSNVPIRLIGRVKSTQTTPGTWAAAPSEVSVVPFYLAGAQNEVYVDTGNGHGSTNNKIRRFTNTRINVGTAITYADSSTLGGSFTVNEDGYYSVNYMDYRTAGATLFGISVNASLLTTGISSTSYAQGFRAITTAGLAADTVQVSWSGWLTAGDIIRAHDIGNCDSADTLSGISVVKVY